MLISWNNKSMKWTLQLMTYINIHDPSGGGGGDGGGDGGG